MNKQEFMAMSLPYGLKFLSIRDKSICDLFFYQNNGYELKGNIDLRNGTDKKEYIFINHGCNSDSYLASEVFFKPILNPLSDLTKEIEHNGEKFVPMIFLKGNGIYNTYEGIKIYLDELCVKDFLKLIEWHFDIAELIEKGEAIDVNTLETNPYK